MVPARLAQRTQSQRLIGEAVDDLSAIRGKNCWRQATAHSVRLTPEPLVSIGARPTLAESEQGCSWTVLAKSVATLQLFLPIGATVMKGHVGLGRSL
jgi:hypothetical protein